MAHFEGLPTAIIDHSSDCVPFARVTAEVLVLVNKRHSEHLQAEEFLKRYLEYCRVKCSPRLTQRAGTTLVTEYVEIRDEVGVRTLPFHAACSSIIAHDACNS